MMGEPPSVLGRVHCNVMESEDEVKSLCNRAYDLEDFFVGEVPFQEYVEAS